MSRPALEQEMVKDFHKILAEDKQLHEFWHILPESGRKAVEDRWLEYAWQMALANAEPMLESTARSFGKTVKQFGAFINICKAGERVEFHGQEWVAMDRQSYTELRQRATRIGPITSESDPEMNT